MPDPVPITDEQLAHHRITAERYPHSGFAACVKEIERLRGELVRVMPQVLWGNQPIADTVTMLNDLIPTPNDRCVTCRHPIGPGYHCTPEVCSNGDTPVTIDREGRPCS